MKAKQLALPGTGRKRKKPAKPDPRLDALFADRDEWISHGGQLAWKQELIKRRTARVERLRQRRKDGYTT